MADRFNERRLHGAIEARAVEGTAGIGGSNHLSGVQIEEVRLADRTVGHVAGLEGKALAKLALDGEVPTHDIGPLELVAGRGERIVVRNIDDAIAEARHNRER